MNLRIYQNEISDQAAATLKQYGLVYLSMEVRTGKTAASLEICKLNQSKKARNHA